MRKTFTLVLALVVSLLTLQASAAMYIVGGDPFGGWQPGNGVAMTAKGDGTYNYSTAISGTVYFVFADGLSSDWNTFNSNDRYGPSNGDTQITVNGNWTNAQKAALMSLLMDLRKLYPQAKILGHRNFPRVAKDCPSFDAKTEYRKV